MSMKSMTALVAALALAGGGLVACGDDDEDEAAAPPPPAATQPDTGGTETTQTGAAAETVEVAADPGGQLEYVQSSLSAPAGSVTFEFTNEASVPHDFNIEQDGEDVAGTEVITNSEASLSVELEPGRYAYYCSVGRHREAGMEGTLTVE